MCCQKQQQQQQPQSRSKDTHKEMEKDIPGK